MSSGRIVRYVVILLVLGVTVLCLGPWHGTPPVTKVLALVKLGALVAAAATSWRVAFLYGRDDQQRRPWWVLALGLTLYAGGQSVLAYHQIVLETQIAFPSWGDPLFVASTLLNIVALYSFCVVVGRSGLPLGTPREFWRPAYFGVGALVVATPLILWPILTSTAPAIEKILNIFYPVGSFIALIPCLVMVPLGLKFRGGRLLGVWLPLALGFAAVLTSDVLFSYLTSLGAGWVEAFVDLLYAAGYIVIFSGTFVQREILKSA